MSGSWWVPEGFPSGNVLWIDCTLLAFVLGCWSFVFLGWVCGWGVEFSKVILFLGFCLVVALYLDRCLRFIRLIGGWVCFSILGLVDDVIAGVLLGGFLLDGFDLLSFWL